LGIRPIIVGIEVREEEWSRGGDWNIGDGILREIMDK